MVSKPMTSELNPGPGFRMRRHIGRPDPALVAGFREFETPMISDLMNRLSTMCTAIRNGACNACHSVEQRLSRWLLTCSDVLESDEIALSQDVFAKMLGVQRTSVNPTLRALQAAGAVALARSRVAIRDRAELNRHACECYQAMRREQALSGPLPDAATEAVSAAPS